MSHAPPMLAASGTLPAAYRVLGQVRRGAVLDVYDVWSEERACRCVAKVLRPDRVGDEQARRRLLREGRLLLRLSHPHIVRAYAVITAPAPAVILETLTGATLGRVLAERPRGLPVRDVAVLGLHLCSAMHYLHQHGVLHLDLKPSNIVCERGVAKVLDLDIARRPGRGPRHGTREYMAPEQVRGEWVTPAADVWAAGVVLFQAASGRLPFGFEAAGDSYPQLTRRATRLTGRGARAALAGVIGAALQPLPADRPGVLELGRSLEAIVGEPGTDEGTGDVASNYNAAPWSAWHPPCESRGCAPSQGGAGGSG